MSNGFNIIFVDDHNVILQGLQKVVEDISEVNILGTYTNPQQAAKEIVVADVQLVVTDISMGEFSGVDLVRAIRKKRKDIKILVHSMHGDNYIIHTLLQMDVDGFVMKGESIHELRIAIEHLLRGETYYCSTVQSYLKDVWTNKNASKRFFVTPRELQILELISQEYTSMEIAEKLFLSKSTVETYRNNLISKFDVKNSVGLVKKALKHNIISE